MNTNVSLNNVSKDDFTKAIQEAKFLKKRDRKDLIKIKNKPIMVQRLIHLYISGVYTNSQIASMLCVSKQTVNKLLKEPEILDEIIKYQDEEKKYIDTRLKSLRDKALDRVSELIDDEDSSVALKASTEILDRTGHAVKKDNNLNITVSYEQRLEELQNTVDTSLIDMSYTDFIEVEENNANISDKENNTKGVVQGD